ncbi:MAG TPA: phosphatidate cytidylyltransferase [Bacteroidia bacterium]|nr:phosphatidate cytidylyltransferase [Bacteroidia bacterium]
MDKNLLQRSITGIIFVAVLVGAILWNAYSMAALFLLIIILGLREFYALAEKTGARPQKVLGILLGILIFLLIFLLQTHVKIPTGFNTRYAILLVILLFPFLLFIIELIRKSETAFSNVAFTLLGCLYISVPFALWNIPVIEYSFKGANPGFHYNLHLLLGFFILLWTNDTMAYVCGRLFGKHKLLERISPKKTWEGFIGGFLFAVAGGWVVSKYYIEFSEMEWMIIAAVISVTGTAGDLVESMFKRNTGVKDAGTLLPGHGGILDRFDGVLMASPFVVVLMLYFLR